MSTAVMSFTNARTYAESVPIDYDKLQYDMVEEYVVVINFRLKELLDAYGTNFTMKLPVYATIVDSRLFNQTGFNRLERIMRESGWSIQTDQPFGDDRIVVAVDQLSTDES